MLIDGTVPDADCLTDGSGCEVLDDPFGNSQELGPKQGSGTKLGVVHTASPPMLDFTNPNGQNDLVKVWLKSGVDLEGDVWLYLAWERDANSGSSVIAYEFHQKKLPDGCDYTGVDQEDPANAAELDLIANCNPWAERSEGDFLVVYDFQGGASEIIIRKFINGAFEETGTNVTDEGFALAELETGDKFKGEAAINLTDSLFAEQNACVTVANVIPGTITGNSDSADYKDTLLAISDVNISNCGAVAIKKEIDPNSLNQDATFSYVLDRKDDSAINYAGDPSIAEFLKDGETDTWIDLLVGTNYQISEVNIPQNFEKVSILCDRPATSTNADAASGEPNVFSIDASTTTNCTITNQLLTGKLTVIKEVNNDNGGTAEADDFCFTLGDGTSDEYPTAGDPGTEFEFLPGHSFNVTEGDCADGSTPPGYSQSYSGCADTIAAGDDLTCTITNDDDAPSLTLKKVVKNDSGGTAKNTEWTLTATGPTGFSGEMADENTGVSSGTSFDAGTYDLSESGGPSGYTSGDWVCTGGTQVDGDTVKVALGDQVECTITNDDDAASLTLKKIVKNDNGGTAKNTEWTLTAAGPTGFSGQMADETTGVPNGASFEVGTYDLSETGPSGYDASDWVCTGGTQVDGDTVTVGLGENVECTITNDDKEPSLTLVKAVTNDNGGTELQWRLLRRRHL
jgi:hypothetical protein